MKTQISQDGPLMGIFKFPSRDPMIPLCSRSWETLTFPYFSCNPNDPSFFVGERRLRVLIPCCRVMKTWTQEGQVICYQEEGPKIESKTPGQEACIPWLPCCSSTPATQLHINQERGRCRNHTVLTAQRRCSGAWARRRGRLFYNLCES